MSVVDTATNTVVTTVTVGQTPRGVAVHPFEPRVYVASQFGNLSIIDTTTNAVINTVPVSSFGVGVEPEGLKVYVPSDDGVAVVDVQTNQIIETLNVGGGSFAFGKFIGPIGPGIFVDSFESGDLSRWLSLP